MSASQFHPQIWHTPGFPPLLVCGSRFLHGQELRGAKTRDPATGQVLHNAYQLLGHAIALELRTFPAKVYFGFKDEAPEIEWTCISPDPKSQKFPEALGGMSRKAAELALGEAWRCVDKYEIDPVTRGLKVSYNADKLLTFRDGAIMRNINIWLSWDAWERDGLTEVERVKVITDNGLKCTAKAFHRVIEDAGLSIS